MPKKREPVVRIAILDWVYRQPISGTPKAILAYLVRRANKDARCWPEQRTIAREVGCAVRTVVYALRFLKLCGLVNVIRQEKRGSGQCGVKNTYQLNYAVEVTPEGARQAKQIARATDQSAQDALRSAPTKVQKTTDQSARGSTEERHEDLLLVSGLSKWGVKGVWLGGDFSDVVSGDYCEVVSDE